MKLREFKALLDKLKDEHLDLEVHILTEMNNVQHEQLLGGLAVPTSYKYFEDPNPVGVPTRIVLYPEGFD